MCHGAAKDSQHSSVTVCCGMRILASTPWQPLLHPVIGQPGFASSLTRARACSVTSSGLNSVVFANEVSWRCQAFPTFDVTVLAHEGITMRKRARSRQSLPAVCRCCGAAARCPDAHRQGARHAGRARRHRVRRLFQCRGSDARDVAGDAHHDRGGARGSNLKNGRPAAAEVWAADGRPYRRVVPGVCGRGRPARHVGRARLSGDRRRAGGPLQSRRLRPACRDAGRNQRRCGTAAGLTGKFDASGGDRCRDDRGGGRRREVLAAVARTFGSGPRGRLGLRRQVVRHPEREVEDEARDDRQRLADRLGEPDLHHHRRG